MSFGSGRSSAFGEKKEKKKKQEYHRRKLKYVEQEPVDFQHLKERTTAALQKLGQQVFSTDGYSFQDWTKSFNFLLDDFEEKVGASNLPGEYASKRSELTAELLRLAEMPEIDSELERIRKEREDLNNRILQKDMEKKRATEEERRETSSKIDALRKQERECTAELEVAKASLEERRKTEKKSSSSFFKKLFSSKSPTDPNSVEGITNKRKDLEEKIRDASEQIKKLQEERNNAKVDSNLEHSETEEERTKLDSLKAELDSLEAKKAERMQLLEKRAQLTGVMSAIISGMNAQAK